MNEFEPTIEPADEVGSLYFEDASCVDAVGKLSSDREETVAPANVFPLSDPFSRLKDKAELKATPATGAEVFYFRNGHGR